MSEPQPKDPYPFSLERAVGPSPSTWFVFPLFIMLPVFGVAMARTTTGVARLVFAFLTVALVVLAVRVAVDTIRDARDTDPF